jgi:hypothetical protein
MLRATQQSPCLHFSTMRPHSTGPSFVDNSVTQAPAAPNRIGTSQQWRPLTLAVANSVGPTAFTLAGPGVPFKGPRRPPSEHRRVHVSMHRFALRRTRRPLRSAQRGSSFPAFPPAFCLILVTG